MTYRKLLDCINDLSKNGQLLKISKEVDPNLEMSSIHLDEFTKEGGHAIFFERIKGTKYSAVSNLFGTKERARFIFRESLEKVKQLIDLKLNPSLFFKHPVNSIFALLYGIYSIPKKVSFPKSFKSVRIEDLPQIKCWKKDGGAFITLPQVYTEDIENPGILYSNLGMYRIQLSGNDYVSTNQILDSITDYTKEGNIKRLNEF